jgi:protein SCO1/2
VLSSVSIAIFLTIAACVRSDAREYELKGQVVAVDRGRQEITIRHEDIPRFMPGMTMPFKVREASLLAGREPGDVVKATLVVEGTDAHLRTLERVGRAPVPETGPPHAPPGLLAQGQPVADLALVDESGEPRRVSAWRGRVLAVTFVYTRCPLPDFCPLMDRHFKTIQERVHRDESLNGRVQLLSVTVDPEHDTPAVLAKHAESLKADPSTWRFLTGTPADVEKFGSQFGVTFLREGARDGEVVHNLRTAIIDPGGRLATVMNGSEWTPADVMEELRRALGSGSGPAGRPGTGQAR